MVVGQVTVNKHKVEEGKSVILIVLSSYIIDFYFKVFGYTHFVDIVNDFMLGIFFVHFQNLYFEKGIFVIYSIYG